MPQRNLLTAVCLAIACLACYSKAPTNRFARDYERAMQIVDRYYVTPQDKQQLFEASLQGMMQSLDEHSAFLPAKQLQSMNEKLDQFYGGVGIRIDFDPAAHRLQVISPILDSPAFEAGILAGDVIVKIDYSTLNYKDGMILTGKGRLVRNYPHIPGVDFSGVVETVSYTHLTLPTKA